MMNPVQAVLPAMTKTHDEGAPLPAAGLLTEAGEALPVAPYADFSAALEPLPGDLWAQAEALDEPPAADEPLSAEVLSAEAEQWLASVFGQRDVQVQVRDSAASTTSAAAATSLMEGATPALAASAGLAVTLARQPVVSHPPAANVPSAPDEQLPEALGLPQPVSRLRDEGLPAAQASKVDAVAAEPLRSPAPLSAALAPLAAPAVGGESAGSGVAAAGVAAERTLSLAHTPQAQWGERMLGALRDSVELQFRHGLQQATIRLDPAELGRLEIQLSHESGRLQVQIQAGQADVVRLLQQTSERLRQELVGQNFVDVSVQVAGETPQERRGRHSPHGAQQPHDIQAAMVVEDDREAGELKRDDVLITV